MTERIRLLIVDDSDFIRRGIRRIFETSDRLEVVGEAGNGLEALEMLDRLQPDVITLDVHMPVMDGVATLKRIMIRNPKPTVMLSNLTLEGAQLTFDTLKYGAVDFIPKPSNLGDLSREEQVCAMVRRIELAAQVQIESIRYLRTPAQAAPAPFRGSPCRYLVAVGAAEGGYGALLKIIPHLRRDLPAAFLVVLHADAPYVDAFVSYLDHCSSLGVKRAADGDRIEAGVCYVACGQEYVTVERDESHALMVVHPAPFENHKGAINMLMISVAENFAQQSGGIILTGSGTDGLEGIGEILRYGGRVLVQEPGSCLHKQMSLAVLHKHRIDAVPADAAMAATVNHTFN